MTTVSRTHREQLRRRAQSEAVTAALWVAPPVVAVASVVIAVLRVGFNDHAVLFPLWLAITVLVGSFGVMAASASKREITTPIWCSAAGVLSLSILALYIALTMPPATM